jgi:hypothetical protein
VRSYSAHLESGCTLKYEYTSSEATDEQLMPSDKEGVGLLVYQVYSSTHDLYHDLGASSRTVTLAPDTLASANAYLNTFQFFLPGLQLQVQVGSIECSRAAIDRMANAALNRKEHVERALTFVSDPDPALQERGLGVLNGEAEVAYLWGLPETQRRQITDLAYRMCRDDLSHFVEGRKSDPHLIFSTNFIGVEMLDKLHDPRAADVYMAYAIAGGRYAASTISLKSLARMLPRPTRMLPKLEELAVADCQNFAGHPCDDVLLTIFVVGREDARPVFERFARSKNGYLAHEAVRYLDGLNDLRRQSRP